MLVLYRITNILQIMGKHNKERKMAAMLKTSSGNTVPETGAGKHRKH